MYRVPGINIATDIICGFPTETKEVTSGILSPQLPANLLRTLTEHWNWWRNTNLQVCSSISFTLVLAHQLHGWCESPLERSRQGQEHCLSSSSPISPTHTKWEKDRECLLLNCHTTGNTTLHITTIMSRCVRT